AFLTAPATPLPSPLSLHAALPIFAQTRRWQALLEPIPHRQRASFFDLVRVSFASGAVSTLLPARAGEAMRVIELKRRRGYPAGALIAAQLAEKGIQAISLGLVLGICALLPGAW